MHSFTPLYTSPYALSFLTAFLPLIIIAAIWTVTLKGFALWHAARNSQKWWFIALLVINTLGILEIIYLVWFRPNSPYAHSKTPTPENDSAPKA